MLVCVALDDKDETVRLAAADALRCLPEADPDTCDETRTAQCSANACNNMFENSIYMYILYITIYV